MVNQLSLFKQNTNYNVFRIENRRYIGSKAKLADWIMNIINTEIKEKETFADIFAGTGIVTKVALKYFNKITMNDIS